jgi:hypothetical protein
MVFRGRILAGTLGCLLATAAMTPALAAGAPVGLDDVLGRLKVDDTPAEYAVLVDTSASMQQNNRYGDVKEVLKTFLGSLRAVDRVDLFTFDVAPSPIYNGPAGGAVEAIGRMPAQATGQYTDIGAAVHGALSQLQQPDAAPTKAIVLLTDGQHEPPPGSAYANTGSPAWRDMTAQAAALGDVRGYAFPLTDEVSGAQLLTTVVSDTTVPRLGADQLRAYLAGVSDKVRRGIAAGKLAPDLHGGVKVDWPQQGQPLDLSGAETPISVQLAATTTALPVELVDGSVVSSLGPVTGLPSRITLQPGHTQAFTVTLHSKGGTLVQLGSTVTPADADLRLTGTVDTPWRQVIEQDLGGKLQLTAVDAKASLRGTVTSGVRWRYVLVVALFLLAAMLLLGRRAASNNPSLRGATLVVYPPVGRPRRVELRGRRMRLDRGTQGRSLGLTGRCEVRGARDGGVLTLVITYTAANRDSVQRRCRPGDSQEIGGVTFLYLAQEQDATEALAGATS